jgi:SnoaL-like domain
MRHQVWSLLTLAVLAAPHSLHAQRTSAGAPATSAQESQLTDLYRRLLRATQDRDTAALKQILTPTYTFVPSRADTILTREQRIATTASDTSGARFQVLGCRSTVYGEAAVGNCRYDAIVPISGTDSTRSFLSTVVFVKQQGKWQIAATHPSFIRPR